MLRGLSGTLVSVWPSSVALCLDYTVSAAQHLAIRGGETVRHDFCVEN